MDGFLIPYVDAAACVNCGLCVKMCPAQPAAMTAEQSRDDIESVVLYQNGEEVKFNGSSLQTPGTYKLVVSDGAGNETVADFTLNYQINGFGIAAILLIIATIIGGVVFVIIVKRKVKVR